VTYERFRATVEAMLDDVPDAFLQELQGVHALREAKAEEGYRDVWRMGEYLDPGPEDFLGGSDGLGRHVALYWGSFRRIAAGDPDFDWEEEIWETLTHELQHHVESLAGDGRLIEQDLLDAQAFEQEEAEERDDRDDAWRASPGAGRDRGSDAAPRGGLGGLLRRVFGGGRD
jgi:hypothetical protein